MCAGGDVTRARKHRPAGLLTYSTVYTPAHSTHHHDPQASVADVVGRFYVSCIISQDVSSRSEHDHIDAGRLLVTSPSSLAGMSLVVGNPTALPTGLDSGEYTLSVSHALVSNSTIWIADDATVSVGESRRQRRASATSGRVVGNRTVLVLRVQANDRYVQSHALNVACRLPPSPAISRTTKEFNHPL
jgi:hypothetical protein